MAEGFVGRKLVFKWNDEEIDGVREKSIEIAGEPINVTSDENDGWQTLLNDVAEKSVTISLSGVTKSHTLRDDWFDDNRLGDVEVTIPGTSANSTLSGGFALASYSDTGSYESAITFECELQSANAVSVT